MKKRNAVYCVTAGHPKKIVRSVILTVLANFGNLIPVGFLTLAVLSLYSYFGGASEVLDLHQLWMVWGAMGIAAVVLYFLELAANHATYYGGYAAGAQGRVDLAEHIRKLPLGYLMSKDPGELGNTMMNDFSLIEDALTHTLPQLIGGAITAVLGVLGMCCIDWRLGLALFAGLPVTVLILLLVQTLDKKRGAAHVAAKIEQTNRLQEYLTGMKVIKAYNLGGSNFTKLTQAFRNFMTESIKLEAVSGPFYLVAISFLQAGISFVTMAGVWLLSGDKVDISVFVMFLFMGNRIFEPLAGAITQLPVFVYKKSAGERIVDLMDEPVMAGDGGAPAQHEIVFDHVSFGYGKRRSCTMSVPSSAPEP